MKFLLTILTISTVFLSATVAALTPAEQCQKQFAPGTPALSNCLKQLNQAAPVKPAPAPLVAVPPPKPAPTPVAVAPPPKPQVQAQVAQPAPKVQPIQQAPLQPSIAPQPARPATAVAPLTPATPAAHAAVNYRVTPPVNVQVGKQMDFVVNVDRGTLPPDIVIVVPNAKLLGKSGNKISFLATTAGNQPFQLKESMSSSAKVLATGSVMVAAAASTPRTPIIGTGPVSEESLGKIILGSAYKGVTQTYLNAYSPTIPGCPQGHFHPGIDYRAASGTSVMSPVAGTVSAVGGSFGTLAVKVGTGADRLLFVHMSSFEVKVGQIIKVGQLLGKSGSAGTKDAHLHVEARTGKDNGACYFPSKSAIGVNKSPTSIVR